MEWPGHVKQMSNILVNELHQKKKKNIEVYQFRVGLTVFSI